MVFDNHDYRIRYYEMLMERNDLKQLPQYALPDGYRFVFYKPVIGIRGSTSNTVPKSF